MMKAAILEEGCTKAWPAAVEGELCVHQTMWFSLVFDHRVVDGAPAARFCIRVKRLIKGPYLPLA
jgi:pyruvate/2-oxoglutarate dehydrogenase complex dihydrolipoamide acyltransferase (E2) component